MIAAATRVPPEIWIEVIREATYLPEALDTNFQDALPPRGTPTGLYSHEVLVMMNDSLATKLAISLVCKMWKSICLKFLYEFIIVRNAHALPRLVQLLSRLGAFKWIQRLDFTYNIPARIRSSNGAYAGRHLVRTAARLVRLCQSLRIFSCRTTRDYENIDVLKANTRYLPNALMHVTGTLESIQWHSFPFTSSGTSFLLDFHQRCLCMRSIFLPDESLPRLSWIPSSPLQFESTHAGEVGDDSDSDTVYDARPTPAQYHSPISHWQSLHTVPLRSDGIWSYLHEVADGTQSLRHLVVETQSHNSLISFISNNPQIDTITFSPRTMRYVANFSLTTIHTVIFPISDLCTDIQFLSVERVGLTGKQAIIPEYYRSAFDQLLGESGGKQFPKLQLIRFVDAGLARGLEKLNLQFKLLDRRCRSKGIRLENEKGELMVPRL